MLFSNMLVIATFASQVCSTIVQVDYHDYSKQWKDLIKIMDTEEAISFIVAPTDLTTIKGVAYGTSTFITLNNLPVLAICSERRTERGIQGTIVSPIFFPDYPLKPWPNLAE